MQRARLLLPLLVLLGWPAGADARRLPDRAVVEREVNAWYACYVYQECAGRRDFHRRVTGSRCTRLGRDEAHPGRILCFFSGVDTARGQRPRRFRNDCAYFIPIRRSWVVSSVPDADVCE